MFNYIPDNVTALITDTVSGKIKQKVECKNQIVLAGLDFSIQQVLSPTQPLPFQYIALAGTKDTEWPPSGFTMEEDDTSLNGFEINISRSDPVTIPNTFPSTGKGEITYSNSSSDDLWVLGAGLFNASGFETGDMLSGFEFASPLHKHTGDTFKLIWSITVQPI